MAAVCDVCGAKIGIGSKIKVLNGVVCGHCGCFVSTPATATLEALSECRRRNEERLALFTKTEKMGGGLFQTVTLDQTHQWFFFGKEKDLPYKPRIYAFDEVERYEVERVGQKTVTKSKGGIGRAVAGGILAGPVGAVVGAATAKQETTTTGGVAVFRVFLRTPAGEKMMSFTNPPAGLPAFLDSCMALSQKQQGAVKPSAADELLKWKALLDQGAITQEEFEVQKKRLLNL